ncbi:MAG: DNA/RNA nuclease SfsA [Deltaproteobacteria bacterium]|nr:MAG: DNA/RNA nuclease SfsA [Deltaproteobacteria bacterium]
MVVKNNMMLLEIPWNTEGVFVKRPNRFLGIVDINGLEKTKLVEVHVHDPGRLPDILTSGNRVRLRYAASKKRKTRWDLIAAKNNGNWVLVHSGYHRKICEELFRKPEISPFKGIEGFKAEVKLGKSRIDFLLETNDRGKIWVEVKGCTLANGKVASFPDAPTTRGARHLEELIAIKDQGDHAAILFLVFRPESLCFLPNVDIDPDFSAVFRKAIKCGVEVRFLVLEYADSGVYYRREIPLCEGGIREHTRPQLGL